MRLYGVTGWKNAGKTGLMERLVEEITARGFTVSTVKHAHHDTDVDQPGRDSHRHRSAGAREVLLASPHRWALMAELREAPEPPLSELLTRLSPVDLVLIEGYKREPHPKVEAHRAETHRPPLASRNATIRAIASDLPAEQPLPATTAEATPAPAPPPETSVANLTRFHLDDTAAIADFILAEVGL